MAEYHGHKTLIDGTHVPLTKDEADAIYEAAMQAREKRAQDMPTARDALAALIRAQQRLNELGWWKDNSLCVKGGDECAVAETGSTGMWRGRLDDERRFVHYGDYASDPRKCWLKPLGELSDDERAWMEECDKREAEALTAMLDRISAQQERDG